MSEKLYTSHCHVPGHGTHCEVADDIYPGKHELSKMRRRYAQKLIADMWRKWEDIEQEIMYSKNNKKVL